MIDALPTGDGVDDDVWRELYAKVHAFVARRVRQDDVDDVVQDVFLRIHRSVLVNVERIQKVEPHGRDTRLATLQDGTELPVSRAGYKRLRELLEK